MYIRVAIYMCMVYGDIGKKQTFSLLLTMLTTKPYDFIENVIITVKKKPMQIM